MLTAPQSMAGSLKKTLAIFFISNSTFIVFIIQYSAWGQGVLLA